MVALATRDVAAFDYAVLAPEVAEAAKRNARLIMEEEGCARASAVLSIIKVGGWLAEIKGSLEHGQFLDWVQAEFRWTSRTAQRYMLAAEAFGRKATQVSYLPPGVVYQLASPAVPADLRDEVVNAADAGNAIPPEIVTERIRAACEAERERRADAKRTPQQRAYRKRVEKSADREKQESQRRVAERDAIIAEAIGMLKDALGDNLPAFVALVKKSDSWYMLDAIAKAADV